MFRKRVFIVAVLLVAVTITVYRYREHNFVESLSSKIIRFHVLANSDSEEDQELKRKVRDEIGAYLSKNRKDSLEESRQMIEEELEEIKEVAEAVVAKGGYEYSVTASLTHSDFPEKSYGAFTFPAGDYEALRVVIGQGQGKNWWCVLYPNLCFYNSVYEIEEEHSRKTLEETLTTQEIKTLMESGNYEVGFKWLKFLNP